MKKYIYAGVLICLFVLGFPARAEEAPAVNLLDKVMEGQKLLSDYKIPKPAKLPKSESRIALAVLDRASGEIEIVNISLVGKKVQVLTHPSWRATLPVNNGVNSQFKIFSPEGKLVLAMKYPVTLRALNSKGVEYRYPADVVYSGYSKDLEAPEIVANGQAYVDNLIATVYARLDALEIKSRSFPGIPITAVLNREMVESLILIEHIGTGAIEADLEAALRRLYTTFGLNTKNTFDYSRSSAGARGIAQFMPSTYKAVVAKRPEMKLIKYFEEGMVDHENALLAEIALMDLHLAALPPDIRAKAPDDIVRTGEYLAASYNGGVARVNWTIEMWGDLWYEDHAADIERERANHRAIDSVIAGLKSKIAKAKTTDEAKKLKADLATKNREHDALVARIGKMRKSTLRLETRNYLKKLRPVFATLHMRQNSIKEQDAAARSMFAFNNAGESSPVQEAPIKKIKFETDPKVYALYGDGTLRWISSEEVALALYGVDWNKDIEGVSDALFANYKIGDPLYPADVSATAQVAYVSY